MPDTQQELLSSLAKARQELAEVRTRVAELEALLPEDQPIPAAPLNSEDYERTLGNLLEGCQVIGFDWHYLYLNAAAVSHSRQTKEALLGNRIMDRYPGIENTAMFALMEHCMKDRSADSLETEFTYPDGSTAWFELRVQPVPTGIFILSLDITERKLAQAKILNLAKFPDENANPVLRVARDSTLVFANPGSERLLALWGCEVGKRLPQDLQRVVSESFATGISRDVEVMCGDIIYSLTFVPLVDAGYVNVYGQDITERKQAEAYIRKLNRTLAVMSDVNQAIVRIRDLPALFEKVCRIAVEQGAFRMAWIGLLDPTTTRIKPVAHAGIADGYLETIDIAQSGDDPHGNGPTGSALRTGKPVVCNDIETDPRMRPWRADALRLGYRASIGLPLIKNGEVCGALTLYADESDFFNDDELKLLDEMAMDLSFAMEVAEQEQQRQQAETAVKHYSQRMAIIHQIDLGLIQGDSIQVLAEATLKHLREIIPCQRADITILDERSNEAIVFAVGVDGSTTLSQGVHVPIPPNVFDGYDARHVRVFDDIRLFQETQPRARRLVNEGLICALSTLLIDKQHPIGTLGLFADTPGYFTAEHQEIVAEIASQLTIAVRQLRLSEDLANHAALLEQRVTERTADLQAAKERVEAILNNSTDGILMVHTDLNIQQTNSSFNRLFACQQADFFGKPLVSIVQAADSDLLTKTVQVAIAEHLGKSIEIQAVRKDGTVFGAELSIGVINEDGLVCSLRDITERKAQERQLRYQATLQDNVSDAVIVTDMEFRVQSWNKAAERIYGWPADEVIGSATAEILRTEFSASELERSIQQLREQGWWQGEAIQYHKDGSIRHILGSVTLLKDESGKSFGIVSVNHDITERKAQERQLRYQASLQENVSDAVIVTDMELRIRTWNRAAERIYGWRAEEVVGIATGEILRTEFSTADTRERIMRDLGEQGWSQEEVIQHHKDGSIRHVLGSVTLVKDESGKPFGIVSINRDITERKRTENELAEERNRLRTVIDTVPDFIFIKDLQHRFVLGNLALARAHGHQSPDELMNKNDFDYFPAALAEQLRANEAEILRTGSAAIDHEEALNGFNGIEWVLTSKFPFRNLNGEIIGLVGTTRDITERKRAEEAVNAKYEDELVFQTYLKALHETTIELTQIDELDAFYRRVVELGLTQLGFERLALFLYDPKDGTAQGTYGTDERGTLVDERNIRFTPGPEGIMTRAFERVERFYLDENVPLFNNLERVGTGWNAATILWNGTRSLGWLVSDNLLSGSPTSKPLMDILGLYGLTVGTLLAQKQGQIALRESEGRYRLLADTINDVVFRYGPNLETTYVSPSSRTVLGYEPEELLGPSDFRNVHPDDRPLIQQLVKRLRENPGGATLVYRFFQKAGHYIWLEASGQAVVSQQTGEIVEFVVSARDITKRKVAEEALRESEEKFRLLMDAAPVATTISDQMGYITLINAQAETLFGYTRAELVGQSVDVLLPDNMRGRHADNRASYIAAPRVRRMGSGLELFARRRDGSSIPVEIELSYVETKTGLLVMSFVVDITERKEAAAALEQQSAFLRSVIDFSPSMIFVKDEDGRFILVNRLVAQMSNNSIDDYIGKTDADFDPNLKEVEAFLEADRRVITSGEPLFLEEPITNLAGETRWFQTTKVPIVSADGKSKHLLGVSTDITQRKKSEQALAASEKRFSLLVNGVHDYAIYMLDINGNVVSWNVGAERIKGYTANEILGQNFERFYTPESLARGEPQAMLKTAETEGHVTGAGWRVRKNGSLFWAEVVITALTDDDGQLIGFSKLTRDMTERRKAEQALRDALEKEKELNELKSRFVSMASHEFRNPLATILALTETLSAYRQRMPDEQIDQRLGKIRDQVGHLKDIMDDVLQLARLQARRADYSPAIVNLDSLCRSVLDGFHSQTSGAYKLLYTCDTPQQQVKVDKKLMRQIISNLVSNAIKYSSSDKPIAVSLNHATDALVLKVRDEGIGIPEADLKHLFEPFHRAANVGTIAGTGLGLVITKESVELHGGTIAVESQVGVGTTFTVTIPVADDRGTSA